MMRAIELFAGAGGAPLGIAAAGFEEVRAVEWNHDACETRRAAGLRCDEGDVRDPAHYEGLGDIDLLWSSFPCQAWSTAGKRLGKDDPRNGWPWTVDVLDRVRPRWFIGENVPGLTFHRGACNGRCVDDCARLYFEQTILRELRDRFAWVGWTILDASRFGVPQCRERLFIVAGPRPIDWPRETHAPPEELRVVSLFGDGRKPWRTVREALNLDGRVYGSGRRGHGMAEWEPRDLTDEPAGTINAMQSSTAAHYVVEDPKHPHARPDEPAPTIRSGGAGHSSPPMWLNQTIGSSQTSDMAGGRTPCESPIDAPAPTVRAQEGTGLTLIQRVDWQCPKPATSAWTAAAFRGTVVSFAPCTDDGTTCGHCGEHRDAHLRLTRAASRPELLDRPSPTVTAVGECKGSGDGGNPEKLQRASDALFLGAGIRRLTTAECAILQDYPEDHPWRGTKTSIYAQIGNAVCPTMARVLCEQVAAILRGDR